MFTSLDVVTTLCLPNSSLPLAPVYLSRFLFDTNTLSNKNVLVSVAGGEGLLQTSEYAAIA